jgi:hypothetical protein
MNRRELLTGASPVASTTAWLTRQMVEDLTAELERLQARQNYFREHCERTAAVHIGATQTERERRWTNP